MRLSNKFLGLLFFMFFQACTDGFEELNTNPNSPVKVQPSLLLRQVIYNIGEVMSYEGFVAGNLLAQHFTMVDFNLFDRHRLTDPQLGGNPWPAIYSNLRDNEIALQLADENSNYSVYKGPLLVMKAYLAGLATDIYGDVPFTEAVRGREGIVQAVYDRQEDIYLSDGGILSILDEAIERMTSSSGVQKLEGDILYSGNIKSWIRFANSLKIKFLMRISKRVDVSGKLQEIYHSGLFISDMEENAKFDFSHERPNSFRMQQLRDGDFNLFTLSATMEEILKQYNDPRIAVLYRPTGNDESLYRGLLNGPDAAQSSISVADYSLPGKIFRQSTGDLDANFMTSWESLFFLAEAAEKKIIIADAQNLYEKAVKQAFEYWHTAIPPNYLSTDPVNYRGSQDARIEKIITQKWIASSINGYEAWIEYRRTAYPKLKTIAASLNDNKIPVRMPYPMDESSLNSRNYLLATAGNGNSVNAPVWWDID